MSTTLDLINSIKIKGSFPTADDLFSSANFFSILNDEMLNHITPILASINEEYFLVYKDYPVTAGQEAYRVPKRAIGSMLRDVQLIGGDGSVRSLPRLYEEDRTSTTNGPIGYYLKSNQVLLSPLPTSTSGTLRLAYFRRPSKFVSPVDCGLISDITGNIVTVGSAPSSFTNNTPVDFVQGDSPYDLLEMDVAIVGVSGTSITFDALPTDLAIGDYVCLAGQTCAPMIPEELVPVLVQAALCTCLSAKKDKSVELELQKLLQMKQTSQALLQPRVRSNDQKIRSSNSLLSYFRR